MLYYNTGSSLILKFLKVNNPKIYILINILYNKTNIKLIMVKIMVSKIKIIKRPHNMMINFVNTI